MASILKVNEIQNASGTSALSVDLSGNTAFTGDVQADTIVNESGDNDSGLDLSTNDVVAVKTGNTERMRVDTSGNLLVGKTSTSSSVAGHRFSPLGKIQSTLTSDTHLLNRLSSDGSILSFAKDGSTVGSIFSVVGLYTAYNTQNNTGYLASNGSLYYAWDTARVYPTDDNARDLGLSSKRFDDVYATNGTIQTSDRNEKQDIAALTATEMLVAARISAMFKTFRWIDKVADNPNARTHTGIIAQDVQQAFTDEGLDAGNYALFVSTTWDDENGNSQTRMGIRYPELLSFIAAYNEQRFASIETRLAALETPA